MKPIRHMKTLLFLTALLLAGGCGEKSEEVEKKGTLEVTVKGGGDCISVSHEASASTISVKADCDWGVTVNDKEWCSVTPSGGTAGTSEVNVRISANDGKHPRENKVVFRYGSEKLEVPVYQDSIHVEKPVIDPSITVPEGYSLVWHDEFDGEKVNTALWKFENWAPGRVNHELQRYVAGGVLDGNYTAYIEEGVLKIRAMKYNGQVISARMNTIAAWKYGYMEARIRLPKGKGTWPAFWMMPKDQSKGWPGCGEIDIMEEVGVDANQTSSSIHTTSYNHTINTQKTKARYTPGAEDDFHTYAIEWTPDGIFAYVDGVHDATTLTFLNDKAGDYRTWPFDKEFYITLNLAWGGDWGGYAGVDENALPAIMQIDYVRVFQKDE